MSIRIIAEAPDAETATEVKERFFKKLYEHSGTKVTFEVPDDARAEADEVQAFAEGKGCTVTQETFEDPLQDAEPVDFW